MTPPRDDFFPAASDPRWLIALFLGAYTALALGSPWFLRSPGQFAAGLAACVSTDLVFCRLTGARVRFPLSAVISSLGLFLLCDSPKTWPYAVVGLLSMLSKNLLRVDGRHVFNPTNFGLTASLLFFGADMAFDPTRWALGWRGATVMCALGLLLSWRARRIDVALSYALGFAALGLARCAAFDQPLPVILGPVASPAFQLFTFYMITDPATTPGSTRGRVLFGASVALAESVLRHAEELYAPLMALFIVSSLMPYFKARRLPMGAPARCA